MAPPVLCTRKSSERSEDFNIIKKPLKKSSRFTAVTIKLNTAPWKHGGTVNEETVYKIIDKIRESTPLSYLYPVKWELDSKCQLHCHTTIESKKTLFRNKVLEAIKEDIPAAKNYSVYLKQIEKGELGHWLLYCNKQKCDIRPIYYRLQHFYHYKSPPCGIIEDFSDLADYDIEYNTKTKHFQHIDNSKGKFDW